MFERTVKALDRWVMGAANRALERDHASISGTKRAEDNIGHPDYFADLDFHDIGMEFPRPGTFRFRSPVESPSAVNNTVHGRFVKEGGRGARDKGKGSLAILLHGWNGEQGYRWLFPLLAKRLSMMGVATAMPELPYHGNRKPQPGECRNFLSGDLRTMTEAARQAIADIRALIQWARGAGYPSIGLWGVSLGAWLGGLAACVEPGLRGLILMSPVPRIDLAIEQLPFCRHIRESMRGKAISAQTLNLREHRPLLSSREMLLIQPRHDLFASPGSVEDLWRVWGQPEIWRVNHGHISILLAPWINNRAALWLKSRLTGERPGGQSP